MYCGRDTLFCHWYAHHVLCEGSQGDRDDPSRQLLEGLPVPPQGTEGNVDERVEVMGKEGEDGLFGTLKVWDRIRSREGRGVMGREKSDGRMGIGTQEGEENEEGYAQVCLFYVPGNS